MPVAIAPFADWSSRTSSWVSTTSSVRANTRRPPSRTTRRRAGGRPAPRRSGTGRSASAGPVRRSCATTSISPEPQRPRAAPAPPITWRSTRPFVEHDALDRALGRAHPAQDLPALERGTGGGRRRHHPLARCRRRSRRSCRRRRAAASRGSRARPVATTSPTMSAPTYAPIDGNSATRPSGWMPKPASVARRSCASRNVATNGDSAIERGSMPSSRCSIVALPTTTAS